jgi:hypothetical protein
VKLLYNIPKLTCSKVAFVLKDTHSFALVISRSRSGVKNYVKPKYVQGKEFPIRPRLARIHIKYISKYNGERAAAYS